MPYDTSTPSVVDVPSDAHDLMPGSRRSRRRFSFSPGIRLTPLPRSCTLGCTGSVMLLAVGADAAGVVLGRVLGDSTVAVATFMIVAVAVLVHAWRQH
jgi:hypothetical protein